MKKKNKFLILGVMTAITAISQSGEIKKVDEEINEGNYYNTTVSQFSESNTNSDVFVREIAIANMVENEINDNIFVEFVDGDTLEEPEQNMELQSIIKTKDKSKNKGKVYAVEKDNYGIVASNIEELDEDYIVSGKVFELTGIHDGLERFNRGMYAFNTQVDKKIVYPASVVYGTIVPKPIRNGIANFYDNFKEIPTFVNSMLQLKPKKAVNALGRFVVNSTIGILGVNDVASKMGMKEDPETMGDTLGHYGIGAGSYLVLPGLGPSTIRDGIGSAVDSAMEGGVRRVAEKELFFDTGVFDKKVYGFTRPVVTGLNARSLIGFKYGDLNSPFEYDLVRAFYSNYRKLQIKK